jgi:hypothetical protein
MVNPAANSKDSKPQITDKTETKPVDNNPYGQSTLKQMAWENGKGVRHEPVTIVFLTGDYAGQKLDLGFNVFELSENQTAAWGEVEARGIRGALQFDRLSNRTFTLNFEFWSDSDDIRQLVENIAHVQEISGKDKTPPTLSITLGKAKISPVVCTNFDSKYSHPLANQGGFRHGLVTLGLKLDGGANSPHATGKPLSATPLADYASQKSETEKETLGAIARINEVLAPCLGDEGSEAIQALLSDNKINDPAEIASLPPRSLVNLAVSGLNPHVLSDPVVQTALADALASTIATTEPGANVNQIEAVARALRGGDASGVSGDITVPGLDGTSQIQRMQADYQTILESIQDQTLGADSPIFDRSTNPTAAARLNRAASCGLGLRSAGGLAGTPPNPENPTEPPSPEQEKAKLGNLNEFFAGKPSAEEISLRLGVRKDIADQGFRDCMINAIPYENREGLENEVDRCSGGKVTGVSVWSRFN